MMWLAMLFLVACNGDQRATATVPITEIAFSEVVPTARPQEAVGVTRENATATISVLPVVTDITRIKPVPEPMLDIKDSGSVVVEDRAPSSTPAIRSTSSPTPDLSNHVDLPSWVNDPATMVIMDLLCLDLFCRDEAVVSLINVNTGTRFDFVPADRVFNLSWGISLLYGLYFELHGFYDATGSKPVPHPGTRIFTESGDIIAVPLTQSESSHPFLSSGGRFAAYRTHQNEESLPDIVTVEDRQTGQVVVLDDPFDGRYARSSGISWSPSEELLAVWRYSFQERGTLPLGGLSVYTTDGRVYRWYDDFLGGEWAGDNSFRMLVRVREGSQHWRRCIVDLQDNSMCCLDEIANWIASQQVDGGAMHWSPDGGQIGFSYWSYKPDTRSGLCTFSLETGVIECPIDNSIIGEDIYIRDFQWSPDGKYLALFIDYSAPGSDDLSGAQLATLLADGTQYQIWGKSFQTWSWRPAPPASTPER